MKLIDSGRIETKRWQTRLLVFLYSLTALAFSHSTTNAQTLPSLTDSNLSVNVVVNGLTQPVAMAFLGPDNFFVTEKASGRVKHVVNGAVVSTVIQLPVNSASERGLLGIALDPKFENNRFVYLYWTESSTGFPTNSLADVGNPNSTFQPGTTPPLGNRVDRFVWDPTTDTLGYDRNLIRLHAFQADAGQPLRGNHNGGLLRFQTSTQKGATGKPADPGREFGLQTARDNALPKLLIIIGDNGRRGLMQNLANGPFGPGIPDDQFGGPEPDNNHLTGVVLRLNSDGSTPADNPFYQLGQALGGEVGANLQKVFAYGIRNSFGIAIDPITGSLWESENGDDSFDEINRIEAGHDGGWIQVMGPLARIAEFKSLETSTQFFGLQQVRWSPTNIADTADQALARMVHLPGAHYADPEFSWKYALAPAGIGFMKDDSIGGNYTGDLFVGASTPALANGYLFRFKFDASRSHLAFTDPRLLDLVADNTNKFGITESESLLFGGGFGISTDIQSGPDGGLYVVSLSNGAVYKIFRPDPARKKE